MPRLFIVYHTLPFRCHFKPREGEHVEKLSLIPEKLDSKSEAPIRRRRRTRSGLDPSFSSFTSLASVPGSLSLEDTGQKSSKEIPSSFSVEPIYYHPSIRIPTEGQEVVYVGLADTEDPDALAFLTSTHSCLPVTGCPSPDAYERYCDRVMTKLFHYTLFEKMRLDVELVSGWTDFERANQCFAETILGAYQEGDFVLLLDHRLILLPKMLRDQQFKIPVALHLGVPFPSSEIFRCHPQGRELLEGMLGCNLIVFQVFSYIRHFQSTCSRLLGLESTPKSVDFNGIPVYLRVVPIGIDTAMIRREATSLRTVEKLEAMRKIFRGKRVMLGIDGMDSAKGIIHKLCGFERLLEIEPNWIGETVLVQVITSKETDSRIMEAAGRINNRFGYLGFNPVQLFHLPDLEQSEYLALLTLADVLLVISERAAFSIPALDFIVCQERRHGQIIISEFVGNAVFIPSVFIVNPWDHAELGMVIQDALTVPVDDMIRRHEEMLGMVDKFGVDYWFGAVMQEFKEAYESFQHDIFTPPLDTNDLYRRYLASDGSHRLFLLDYDGTLIGIKRTPSEATPSYELRRALRMLCRDPSNLVYVISGRDKSWLESTLGSIHRLGLSAEHGCYLRPVTLEAISQWIQLVREEDLTWKPAVLQIMQYYTERTPGSFVEEKSASCTWHYRLADEHFGTRQANELQNYLEQSIAASNPIEVLAGKKNIEVRPVMASKGNIVRDLLTRHHPISNFIFCLGDDRTDEDMFRMILEERPEDPGAFTCKVGASKDVASSAKFGLRSAGQVVALLSRLALASSERAAHSTI